MKISIAMATYNGEKYLHQQLQSFSEQTRLPDELIIYDDNSNDNSIRIINDFIEKKHFPVQLYRNAKNVGYIKNFEQSIEKATGDLIFLSDQDDVWFPEKIDQVEKIFKEKPGLWLVINDREFVDENLVSDGKTNLQLLQESGIPHYNMRAGCCTTFRKVIKPYILPISSHVHGHDVWIHRIAEIFDKKHVSANVLQYYRRHSANASEIYRKSSDIKHSVKSLFKLNAEPYMNEFNVLVDLRNRLKFHNLLSLEMEDLFDKKIESFRLRADLLNSSFFSRKLKAAQLLKDGQYKNFRGFKSFLKDFIA